MAKSYRQIPTHGAQSLLLFLLLCIGSLARADFQGSTHLMPFEEDTIGYNKANDTGPVARLQDRIEQGKTKLKFDPDAGYLRALLQELNIPTTSQMLVFSKTSFQRERISPETPRAIYFGDDVYIGFIPGSPMLEITSVDPKLGGVFYTLDQTATAMPRFKRTDQCLECHASAKTMGVPGHVVRSFVTDERGVVDLGTGVSQVNHRTPLAERWGGWYVTGTAGNQAHRGNLMGTQDFARKEKEPAYRHNITNLNTFFDVTHYPSADSDIVALMVLEHQTHMHNFITRLNYAATLALQQYGHVNYLKSATDGFLKYLLFTEEAPLTAPLKGTSGFTGAFAAKGPRDSRGRSLREFDLQTRLFKYPCSYLIYSDPFTALPAQLKDRIYQRLWEILSGKDSSPDFESISPETRRAILEILAETKRDLPSYWTIDGSACR